MFTKIAYIFIIFLFVNGYTFANDSDVYYVPDVVVSVTSVNATKAKDNAIKTGQRKALQVMFDNMGMNKDYTKFINDSTVSEMVESIKISDEVITKNSYSSKINITFNKAFVDYNLKSLNIAKNKITENVFLYIPLFEENGKIELINSENSWYSTAYNEFFEGNYDNIYIIDNYNLANAALISEKNIKDPLYEDFSTLLKKYNSNTILISIAKFIEKENRVEIILKEIDANGVNQKTLNFSNKDKLTNEELIKNASIRIIKFISNEINLRKNKDKQSENNFEFIKTKKNVIDVSIVINNLRDYVYVFNLLKNIDFIIKCEQISMTTKIAHLKLTYSIDESELVALLNEKGFILTNRNDINFLIYKGF